MIFVYLYLLYRDSHHHIFHSNHNNNIYTQRTIQKANEAADKIKTNIANDSDDAVSAISTIKSLKLIPMECDLADLSSIDSFVKKLNGDKFDAVCYNAGIARNTEAKDVARTKQGFELTVGKRHNILLLSE